MIPYFILLFVIAIFSSFIPKNIQEGRFSFPIFLILALLVFFESVREVGVGTDSGNYVYLYGDLVYGLKGGFQQIGNIEIGFVFLNYLLLMITEEYWILFAGISLIVVSSYLFVFRRASLNMSLSIFLFLTSAIYLFSFNGARQGLAAAFVAIAINYALEKKLKFFLLFVFLGTLFHKTAIMILPFYYLMDIRFSLRNLFLLVIISFLPLNYLSEILSLADKETMAKYSGYIDRGATGGELLTIFFVVNSIILVYFRKEVSKVNIVLYDKLLFMANVHTLVYFVVVVTGKDINLARFSIYFGLAFPLIWPILFKDSRTFNSFIYKGLVITAYVLFYAVYLDKMSNLSPYELNPTLW